MFKDKQIQLGQLFLLKNYITWYMILLVLSKWIFL